MGPLGSRSNVLDIVPHRPIRLNERPLSGKLIFTSNVRNVSVNRQWRDRHLVCQLPTLLLCHLPVTKRHTADIRNVASRGRGLITASNKTPSILVTFVILLGLCRLNLGRGCRDENHIAGYRRYLLVAGLHITGS